jgi:hypothetical protein
VAEIHEGDLRGPGEDHRFHDTHIRVFQAEIG